MLERQTFQNKDLVLKVSPNYDPKRFDPNKYEAFLDALCGDREYQKEAIREAMKSGLGWWDRRQAEKLLVSLDVSA